MLNSGSVCGGIKQLYRLSAGSTGGAVKAHRWMIRWRQVCRSLPGSALLTVSTLRGFSGLLWFPPPPPPPNLKRRPIRGSLSPTKYQDQHNPHPHPQTPLNPPTTPNHPQLPWGGQFSFETFKGRGGRGGVKMNSDVPSGFSDDFSM